jgi:hypothetical protein
MGTFFNGGFMKNLQPVIPDGDPDVENSVNIFIHQLSVPTMVKFTDEDIDQRTAEAEYKIAVADITGVQKYNDEAALDMCFIKVMTKIVNDQRVNISEFLR